MNLPKNFNQPVTPRSLKDKTFNSLKMDARDLESVQRLMGHAMNIHHTIDINIADIIGDTDAVKIIDFFMNNHLPQQEEKQNREEAIQKALFSEKPIPHKPPLQIKKKHRP